jgi:nitric oxide reductase large subunit
MRFNDTVTLNTKRLWTGFILEMADFFGILGWYDREIYRDAPLIPERIIVPQGLSSSLPLTSKTDKTSGNK